VKVIVRDHGGPWRKVLTIEVPSEDLDRAFKEVTEEFQMKTVLPGFRKGHVPRNVLELQFGHSMEHEVLERVVKRSYEAALHQESLDPVSYPTIDKIDLAWEAPDVRGPT
jgi:trigger factor